MYKKEEDCRAYYRAYYRANREKLLEYQKRKQSEYRKKRNLPLRERALKAWKTRREG